MIVGPKVKKPTVLHTSFLQSTLKKNGIIILKSSAQFHCMDSFV